MKVYISTKRNNKLIAVMTALKQQEGRNSNDSLSHKAMLRRPFHLNKGRLDKFREVDGSLTEMQKY